MPRAARVKLTDAFVEKAALPAGKTEHIFWDSEVIGFGLRVRSEAKTYLLMYRPAGAGRTANARKYKIGTAANLKATDARQLARVQVGSVAAGKNPAAERAEEKRRSKAVIGELLDKYEAALEARGYVDRLGTMSTLRRNLHSLRNRDAKTIAGSEIVDIRDRLAAAGLEGAADNFFSRCRAFFSWCLSDQKVIDTNPVFAHRKEKRTRADKLLDEEVGRALSDDELAAVWNASLPDASGGGPSAFGDYLRFLILTGCRRTEASRVARSMSRKGKGGEILVIPKQITKSGRDHNLPVTAEIASILNSRGGDDELYFPSWRTGRPMQGWAKMLKKAKERSGVDFDLHDLRRTFRTGLSALRIPADIAEICINHSRRGLEAVYNRDTAGGEMRGAFTAWSLHVGQIVRRSSVEK